MVHCRKESTVVSSKQVDGPSSDKADRRGEYLSISPTPEN